MTRVGRLQTRLFLWFLGAIVLAIAASSATWILTRSTEPHVTAGRLAMRSIAANVAKRWDDPEACAAYLERVHEVVGLSLRLRRDVGSLPHMRSLKRGGVGFDTKGEVLIPVMRDHELLGAIESDVGTGPPPAWNLMAALGAAVLALALAARFVSRRLARPLEALAQTAERFGGGDLATRTHIDDDRKPWIAEEVREVARAFDRMAERIEGVVRDQRELLGAISHELRSPLGRARVALEITRDRASESQHASLDEVERQLADVDAILGDLLAATRAGLTDLRAQPTDLLPWLRARVASEPAPPEIELVSPEPSKPIVVNLEPALMNRAMHNLFANARAHGHPNDRPIVAHVELEGDSVRILVRDAGPGFSVDLLARAFDPFVKGDVARTPGAVLGSGLGLALVRRIVEAHGGRAFAKNLDEAGAEVGIELPLRS